MREKHYDLNSNLNYKPSGNSFESCNVNTSVNQYNNSNDVSDIYGSVFDYAFESGHTIDDDLRESLDDSDFGIPSQRKYPLRVPGNKKLTEELVGKAIQMFHYCKPEWKAELANNIVNMIKAEDLDIKIDKNSKIFRYVSTSDLPDKNIK